MKVGIQTLGCKVNLYESEYIINLLKNHDFEIGEFKDFCDIYIINTCTVTNASDAKSRKMIRAARKKNPEALIVAIGCFVQKNTDLPDEIDIAIGSSDKTKIIDLIKEYQLNKLKLNVVGEISSSFEDMYIDNFENHTRAFVKIQDGCENFCSYCIIPTVRGRCRSKEFKTVIKEIKALVKNGYQEVILTGIHTGNYGVDINTSLAELLKELVLIEGLKRLRISSIEITEINEEILELLKNTSVIVDHLHIPIQSASNEVLKLMKRKYNLDYFKAKIKELRKIRPNISITTDLIVAHPGETDEEFKKSLAVLEELEFAKIHVFPYSKRENTVSASLEQIDELIKKQRVKEVLALSKKLEDRYYKKFIGQEKEFLIEKTDDKYSYGYSDNYLYMKINKIYPVGSIVKELVR